MLPGPVPSVGVKRVLRIGPCVLLHQGVPRDFSDDGGSGDCQGAGIALDYPAAGVRRVRTVKSVDQDRIRNNGTLLHDGAGPVYGCLVDVSAFNLPDRNSLDHHMGVVLDNRKRLLPLPGGQTFRIVNNERVRHRPPYHPGHDKRPGQRPTARFINPQQGTAYFTVKMEELVKSVSGPLFDYQKSITPVTVL